MLTYNHDTKKYDHLIGNTVRDGNRIILGTIESIEYSQDGWHHDIAWAILNNGRRINCRTFGRDK